MFKNTTIYIYIYIYIYIHAISWEVRSFSTRCKHKALESPKKHITDPRCHRLGLVFVFSGFLEFVFSAQTLKNCEETKAKDIAEPRGGSRGA